MKLDIKSIIIIILSCLLIIGFVFRNKETIVDRSSEIKTLNETNKFLLNKNNDLFLVIDSLNNRIDSNKLLLDKNDYKVKELQIKIKKLKDEKNKISAVVNSMSSNDITISFTNYLNKRL